MSLTTNNKNKKLLLFFTFAGLAILGVLVFLVNREFSARFTPSPTEPALQELIYENQEVGLKFTYPSNFYLEDRKYFLSSEQAFSPNLVIVLRKKKDVRDLLTIEAFQDSAADLNLLVEDYLTAKKISQQGLLENLKTETSIKTGEVVKSLEMGQNNRSLFFLQNFNQDKPINFVISFEGTNQEAQELYRKLLAQLELF